MTDLRILTRAAEGAADVLGSRWWWLTWLALETALWAAERAELATGASLDDAVAVLEDTEA
jgi:hypothetical protein